LIFYPSLFSEPPFSEEAKESRAALFGIVSCAGASPEEKVCSLPVHW